MFDRDHSTALDRRASATPAAIGSCAGQISASTRDRIPWAHLGTGVPALQAVPVPQLPCGAVPAVQSFCSVVGTAVRSTRRVGCTAPSVRPVVASTPGPAAPAVRTQRRPKYRHAGRQDLSECRGTPRGWCASLSAQSPSLRPRAVVYVTVGGTDGCTTIPGMNAAACVGVRRGPSVGRNWTRLAGGPRRVGVTRQFRSCRIHACASARHSRLHIQGFPIIRSTASDGPRHVPPRCTPQ